MTSPDNRCIPPVIMIGMHRSGTSMVARALEEMGVFMGKVKDQHHEAALFRFFNEWLLRLSGASWDHPEPTQHLLSNIEIRAIVVDYIRHLMVTIRAANYLGWGKYLRYRTPANLDIPWGWKDPRNTLTLPIWLDLFPDARVIYIYRNGVDVANSLKVRSEKDIGRLNAWTDRRMMRRRYDRRPFPIMPISLRCLSLDEGFALWEAYTKIADEYLASLSEAQAFAIRYEDFVNEPASTMMKMCEFIGVAPESERIAGVASNIDPTRAKVYQQVPELIRFHEFVRNSSQMKRYSY